PGRVEDVHHRGGGDVARAGVGDGDRVDDRSTGQVRGRPVGLGDREVGDGGDRIGVGGGVVGCVRVRGAAGGRDGGGVDEIPRGCRQNAGRDRVGERATGQDRGGAGDVAGAAGGGAGRAGGR